MANSAGISYPGIAASVFFSKVTQLTATPRGTVTGTTGTNRLGSTLVLESLVIV